MTTRGRGFALVSVAYLAALAAAVPAGAYAASQGASELVAAAVADAVATVVVFGASVAFRNSSFYDAYWSVAPPILFAFWIVVGSGFDVRMGLASLVVLLWAVRLTWNWARGWEGLSHEDWRYEDLKAQTGGAYWLVNFLGIHFFPTVLVFIGCVPLWVVSRSYEPVWWLDGAALLLGLFAVWLQWASDNALHEFRAERSSAEEVLRTGLWRRCRHPNYLGEILFWTALALFGVAAGGAWWVLCGAALMVLLFVGISIPMIDRRMLANKPTYASYRAVTPALLPRLRV